MFDHKKDELKKILHAERQIEHDEEAEIFLELASLSVEERQLRVQEHLLRGQFLTNQLLRKIIGEVAPPLLTNIKIQFSKGTLMPTAPVVGPITLTAVDQAATASVVGFDQFGKPFTGVIPTPTLASDDAAGAIVSFDPATGLIKAVGDGVANISGTVVTTGPDGNPLTLTDSETVTVAIPVVAPILSSIKIAFSQ